MKLNLDVCKIFNVVEGQHFWVKYRGQSEIEECLIKGNQVWFITDDRMGPLVRLNLFDIEEVYYKNPIELIKNTKQFLKTINTDFKYIARDKNGVLSLYDVKPKRDDDRGRWLISRFSVYCNETINEESFDIDLSSVRWEDKKPTLIEKLLKEVSANETRFMRNI